jgi:battenin
MLKSYRSNVVKSLQRQPDYDPVNHEDDEAEVPSSSSREEDGLYAGQDGVIVHPTSVASAGATGVPVRASIAPLPPVPPPALAFLVMGLLNNASYVIMLASAKSISEGGTGLVFLSCVIPSLTLKASAPYWFDKVDYHKRLTAASFLMAFAFSWVAFFSYPLPAASSSQSTMVASSGSVAAVSAKTVGQLMGVAMISLQCGLGEASLLALAGKCDRNLVFASDAAVAVDNVNARGPAQLALKGKGRFLTCFSSGTGMSGPFGFLWKIFWTEWIGLSLRMTCCLAAFALATMYSYVYHSHLGYLHSVPIVPSTSTSTDTCFIESEPNGVIISPYQDRLDESIRSRSSSPSRQRRPSLPIQARHFSLDESEHSLPRRRAPLDEYENMPTLDDNATTIVAVSDMSRAQRFRKVLSLWPYTIPLFTVYAAEYACQAGAWTAIGFPLSDVAERNHFYLVSNWLYQLGVFFSRSSGTFLELSLRVLWLMPFLQVVNLVFFSVSALYGGSAPSWWYNQTFFYAVAFYAGLLGGAVYVHGYVRIVKDVAPLHTEFALAATSVAESIGILFADLTGLVLQSCIYKAHEIDGALLECPF